MASHLKTCKVLSQFLNKQTAKALLLNRGRMFISTSAIRPYGGRKYLEDHGAEVQKLPIKTEIGTREVVGYGMNGEEIYIDHVAFPFPAIRFKEDTPEILKLKEKEKGDWKKMTLFEKKELYRASFAQTLVETKAPTGEWKAVFGIALACVAIGMWGYVWLATYAYDELPITMTDEEHLKGKIKQQINLRVGPVDGFASHYDYENNRWKSMP